MTTEQMADILRKHKMWLESEPGGTWANLTGAYLSWANLTGANLTGAYLSWANLTGADLTGADLTGANLTAAVLRGAVLTGADLRGAILTGAVLRDADLRGADLRGAILTGAILTGAVLRDAVLRDADLTGEVLRDADLRGAILRDAVLRDANLTDADVPVIPDLDRRILAAIEVGGRLEMNAWHTCDTTHCRAGWAVVVSGEAGAALERAVGTPAAAALMYAAIRPDGRVPDFYASNEDALADIRRCAALPLESQS